MQIHYQIEKTTMHDELGRDEFALQGEEEEADETAELEEADAETEDEDESDDLSDDPESGMH